MTYGDDISHSPHRLKVVGYDKQYQAHRCEINGIRVFVDILIDGTIPEHIEANDIIGKEIDVDYTHGYIWIAQNPRLVEDDAALSKASAPEGE